MTPWDHESDKGVTLTGEKKPQEEQKKVDSLMLCVQNTTCPRNKGDVTITMWEWNHIRWNTNTYRDGDKINTTGECVSLEEEDYFILCIWTVDLPWVNKSTKHCLKHNGVDSIGECIVAAVWLKKEDCWERKAKTDTFKEMKAGEGRVQETGEIDNTKNKHTTMERRVHCFPHLPLSDWKVIYNTESFQPSREEDNWPVEAGRWGISSCLYSKSDTQTQLDQSPSALAQGPGAGEEESCQTENREG